MVMMFFFFFAIQSHTGARPIALLSREREREKEEEGKQYLIFHWTYFKELN